MNIFYYKCKGCGSAWNFEEGAGWVDERGNFGHSKQPEGTNIGKPEGAWEPVKYIEKLCLACNGKYTVLSGNVRSYPVKPLQVVAPGTQEIHVVDNTSTCPVCKSAMFSGRELLDRVINRDRCSKFMLSRIPTAVAAKCPKCKVDYFRYDNNGSSQPSNDTCNNCKP
jgi:hypothetical protein